MSPYLCMRIRCDVQVSPILHFFWDLCNPNRLSTDPLPKAIGSKISSLWSSGKLAGILYSNQTGPVDGT